ncbi:KGK domain-containing protein [Microcoleus sp. herbarium14]|uniref:KGK domain-containing protein n=1 Tax=Microcoleus sp. herbarium14 TaxID=3055439 RepID=UPI002FD35AF8
MDEKVEINKNYEILDGDDDVLLLGQATFTVRRFKELASSKLNKIMLDTFVAETNQHLRRIIDWIQYLSINEETKIMGGDINWKSPQEGIDCQILKIGSKGWQKGKLQIEINQTLQSWQTQVCIKFCPDEPPEQKSPLDDIRQSEEYKKLLENN